jgi:predicted GTPase
LNQVDLVEPLDWQQHINLPSKTQEDNIEIILDDRRKRIESVLGLQPTVIPYGAKQKYRLMELFDAVIHACPPNRRWIFDSIKAVSTTGFLEVLPPSSREEVLKAYAEEKKRRMRKEQPGMFERLAGAISEMFLRISRFFGDR